MPLQPSTSPTHREKIGASTGAALLALGVVFGDIGTSPLYAYETALVAAGGTPVAAIGAASLILWTLLLVVTVKYSLLVMRADYQGEGGIFALMALLRKAGVITAGRGKVLALLLVFGAALLFGDGAITPAISVLSAVEGMASIHPDLGGYVLPAAVLILSGLFFAQRFGTGRLGVVFGPVMMLWFVVIGLAGFWQILQEPGVMRALNPLAGWHLLMHGGWQAFALVGAVVLAVTGAEALYADLGHFGRKPILRAWRWVVFPALACNYLGQAAHVVRVPASASDPNLFFLLVPVGGPREALVILATVATVIASQALISGVFSLCSQAMDLGYLPRLYVRHTSAKSHGQIYIPLVNVILGVICLLLVLGFRSSSALASAYGVAVTGAMLVTTLGFTVVLVRVWKKPVWLGALVFTGLMAVDLPLFLACLTKLADGGIVPVILAAGALLLLTTWKKGRDLVHEVMRFGAVSVDDLSLRLARGEWQRVACTQVFVVRKLSAESAVATILEQTRRVTVVGERAVILLLEPGWNNPMADVGNIRVTAYPGGLWVVRASHGFMVEPDVPRILEIAAKEPGDFQFSPGGTFYVVAREMVVVNSQKHLLPRWQSRLYSFMSRNVVIGPDYLGIPPDRLILYSWIIQV
jgi:KUP system potassium uptake protein